MIQEGIEAKDFSAFFMLNIEILDCFTHCTLVIQKTIVLLYIYFIFKKCK
jgi:hypothetical protein